MAKLLYPLNEKHLQAFGGIVQQFARFERLIEIAVSAYLNKSAYTLTAIQRVGGRQGNVRGPRR